MSRNIPSSARCAAARGLFLAAIAAYASPLALTQEEPNSTDGPLEESWPNGNRKLSGVLKNGQPQGAYTEYYESGGKERQATYRDGILHGSFQEWHENGKSRLLTNYRDGLLHGKHTEYHDNGRPRLVANYRDGVLHGSWASSDEQGRKLVRCNYKEGALDGEFEAFHENGKRRLLIGYRNNRLDGIYAEFDDKGKPSAAPLKFSDDALFPRSQDEIRRKVAAFRAVERKLTEPYAERPALNPISAGKLSQEHLDAALARLKTYRYLTGVPFEKLTLNDRYNSEAQHGATLLAKLGYLEHKPPRPADVPEEFYKIAYEGTSKGNIWGSARARGTLVDAVDSWMDDSDPSNIDRLGHRRWCLNPLMGQTGFGYCEGFGVLWSLDKSQNPVPDFDLVAFPPSGYYPNEYWGREWAWNVTLNPKKFANVDAKAVQARIIPLDERYQHSGEALALDYHRMDTSPYGVPLCLIFRPKALQPGRYWVEIAGLKDAPGGRLVYIVEFFALA